MTTNNQDTIDMDTSLVPDDDDDDDDDDKEMVIVDDDDDNDNENKHAPEPKQPGATVVAGRPWVERYRPKTLNQVSHQPEVVATLQTAVATGRLPHLLFYGPPGSGKTSAALALCRQLWDPSQWRRRVLELNASDERGISVVRDKIKHFASLSVGGGGGNQKKTNNSKTTSSVQPSSFFTQSKKKEANDETKKAASRSNTKDAPSSSYPNPPYKIIILDEADTVTPDAQAALRRIIEAYSKITRFILICNYVTRIIEPLASRCAKFRFQALPPESMRGRLTEIAQAEQCQLSTKSLTAILQVAKGDMRRAVTTLQSAHALQLSTTTTNSSSATTQVDDEDLIAEMAGLPPPRVVEALVQSFQQGTFDVMKEFIDNGILAEGYSGQFLLSALLPVIAQSQQLTELSKAELCLKMAESEHAIVQGADEGLQLLTVGSTAVQCFAKSKRELATKQAKQ